MTEGGKPGVGGEIWAKFFAVRLCMREEGSDFEGGNNSEGGSPEDDKEEEDMVTLCSPVKRPDLNRDDHHATSEEIPWCTHSSRHSVRHPHRYSPRTIHSFVLFFWLFNFVAR